MGTVLSFAAAREKKLKGKLSAFADTRTPAVVETRNGPVNAVRIFCREAVAVLIDKYGYRTRLKYERITDVSPMIPIVEIVSIAERQVVEERAPQTTVGPVLTFPPPSRPA